MINVTKTYLPNKNKLYEKIDRIYKNGWITNNGQLVQELETKLAKYLGVKNLILVSNGTLALQVSYKALQLTGEAITTPFSFIATTSSMLWEGIKPVYADIERNSFNIDPREIQQKITKRTSAIVPVHVFGNPCNLEEIQAIASKHNLKIIYDAAHAFGTKYKGKSVLNYGDISILSFHATKLFHTIEGGAIITKSNETAEKVREIINFGINKDLRINRVGINAKMNEFQAAMGLCVLEEIENIKSERQNIWQHYKNALDQHVTFQKWNNNSSNNYSYIPVLLDSEEQLKKTQEILNKENIFPRRYFYPSLDSLNITTDNSMCTISEDISKRILCLPLYPQLRKADQDKIIEIVKANKSQKHEKNN